MIKPKQTELKPNTNKFFIFSQRIKHPLKKKRRLKKIKKLQIKRIQFLLAINSYKGVRLKKGLPARGQRTRTNAVSCLKKIKLYDTQKSSKIISRRKNF
jgi:ribosomal protein S13